MIKNIFNKFCIPLVLGGFIFWGSYYAAKFIRKNEFNGLTIILLTIIVPLVTYILFYSAYRNIISSRQGSILTPIYLGIVGPLLTTYIIGLFGIILPALKEHHTISISNILFSLVIIPLSVLTYTGMLGAMIINIIVFSIISLHSYKQLLIK